MALVTSAARLLSSLIALVVPAALAASACGAPAAEGVASVAPGATTEPASQAPPGAAPGADGPRAAVAPAVVPAPGEASTWPFGPAPSAEELQAQRDRLAQDPGPIRTNWTPPGKTHRYGRAEGLIAAPYDVVRARLLDFAHYQELAGPKFKKVRVVDKTPAGTDLYFQLPIMKGLVTLWYVTRFASARAGMGGAEIVEGTFVKGNIKDMQIVFTLRPAPEQKTILTCDLNLAITIPAPQELLDEELRDACGDAVKAVRARTAPPPAP
jgi:hypothetical protein